MPTLRVIRALVVMATFAVAFAVLPAWADSHARIVRLSYVQGNVQIDRGDGSGFQSAFLNMPIAQGMSVWTRDGARAEVEFEEGGTVRLAPATKIVFAQLGLRDSGAKFTSIDMQEGTAYFNLHRKGQDEFNVSSGQQQIHLPDSARFRVEADQGAIKIAVFNGKVDYQGSGSSATIKKNQTLSVDAQAGSRYLLAKGIDPESYDSWDQERDSYRDQYASASNYHSSNIYGFNDLNYYGGYFNSGSYGTLWRPYSVPVGWSPFADGAWVFYPGYGYQWVSAYPWGWAPYHYGSWLFVPGYGWCWQPARVFTAWAPVTPIYNAPAGFQRPTPPATPPLNHGTGIVAVGHGPTSGIPNGRLGWQGRFQPESGIVDRPVQLNGRNGGLEGAMPKIAARQPVQQAAPSISVMPKPQQGLRQVPMAQPSAPARAMSVSPRMSAPPRMMSAPSMSSPRISGASSASHSIPHHR